MAGKAVEGSGTSIIVSCSGQTPGLDPGSRAATPSGWLAGTMAREHRGKCPIEARS